MAQFSTDFSESTQVVGYEPPDWTARWGAAESGTTTVYTIEEDTTTISFGDQVLLQNHAGGGQDCALSWDDVGTPADVDVVMRVRWISSAWDGDGLGLVVRGDEDSTGLIGYALRVNWYSNIMRILKFNGGPSELVSVTLPYELKMGGWADPNWWWLRFQISGTAIKARIWNDGEDEHSTWHIDTTDSDISAGGWVGAMSWQYDGEADWIGVGTEGSAPPAQPAAEGDVRITQVAVEVLRRSLSRSQPGAIIAG